MTFQYLLEHFAVATSAVSGVLAGSGKRVDLFGVVVLGLVTAFGGGTTRDVLLGDFPVVWIRDPNYLYTALSAALFTFLVARRWDIPRLGLDVADAFGLALFTMIGARRAYEFGLAHDAPLDPMVEVGLGVVTGVAGGALRDTLIREIPLVFRREIHLYATAAIAGAVALIVMRHYGVPEKPRWLIAIGTTLTLRLIAIRWKLSLPTFQARTSTPTLPSSTEGS
jgi:uncharacterized membrane protein YeiH